MGERAPKNAHLGDFSTKFGMPDRIRTYDLLLRKQTLYPAELRAHIQYLASLPAFRAKNDKWRYKEVQKAPLLYSTYKN